MLQRLHNKPQLLFMQLMSSKLQSSQKKSASSATGASPIRAKCTLCRLERKNEKAEADKHTLMMTAQIAQSISAVAAQVLSHWASRNVQAEPTPVSHSHSLQSLPSGWRKWTSTSGRVFYEEEASGRTSFTMPGTARPKTPEEPSNTPPA